MTREASEAVSTPFGEDTHPPPLGAWSFFWEGYKHFVNDRASFRHLGYVLQFLSEQVLRGVSSSGGLS